MNFQAVDQANGNNVTIWATLTSWEGIAFTTNQAKYLSCKLKDDNNIEHKCRIYEGKGTLPGAEHLEKRMQFSIGSYQGNYKGQPYTGYSGFWSHGAATSAPQNPQQAPSQPAQGTNHPYNAPQGKKEPDWDAKDLRMARMNALTNSTRLICLIAETNKEYTENPTDDPTLLKLITKSAEILVNYIYNGLTKKQAPDPDPSIQEPKYQANPDYVSNGQEGICPHCQKLLEDCTCDIKF